MSDLFLDVPHARGVVLTLADWRSGDWASGVWGSTGIPGQDQSCAQMTGVSDCATYVRNNGAAFAEACKYYSLESLPQRLLTCSRRLGSPLCADLPELITPAALQALFVHFRYTCFPHTIGQP